MSYSFYKNTDISDFYLGFYTPVDIQNSIYDEEYIIEAKYNNRPDLLSYELYGTPSLWWAIVQRNIDVIEDPLSDFTTGKRIFIPSIESIN